MRFIALNKVNNKSIGDAFYFETLIKNEKKCVLVDGGRVIRGFTNLLISNTGVKTLDVVACTHDDADHTYGIIDLLNNPQKIKIKEIWLPLNWMHFKDVVTEYKEDIDKLKEDLKSPKIYKFIKKHKEYEVNFDEKINFEDVEYYRVDTEELSEVSSSLIDNNEEFFKELEKEIQGKEDDQEISEVITKVYHTLNNIFKIANLAKKMVLKLDGLTIKK
ncbi:DUF2100 domain-containing protein [Planococcus koreensis]|uniref:DUF2100 domain-containing protein n=1 Tax=Planococcus koreensis TaxID=112331 RepID=UPI00107FE716|nr:MBL fold metallo-hydrolase [Planococcus koreensis]